MARRNKPKNRAKGKNKKKNNAGKNKKNSSNNNKKGNASAANRANLLHQMGEPVEKLFKPDRDLRGPTDEERKFPKWSSEQIERFLKFGEWDSDDEDDEEKEKKESTAAAATVEEENSVAKVDESNEGDGDDGDDDNDAELTESIVSDRDLSQIDIEIEQPLRPMPLPRPLESVFGAAGGAEASASGQTGFLGALLNPDAGGKGRNKDGIMGLIAAQQKPKPEDPRAALKARIRYLRRQRGSKQPVYDARGRKVKGAVQMTSEDMMYGGARARNAAVDKSKSDAHRKQIIEKLRQEAAVRAAARNEQAN